MSGPRSLRDLPSVDRLARRRAARVASRTSSRSRRLAPCSSARARRSGPDASPAPLVDAVLEELAARAAPVAAPRAERDRRRRPHEPRPRAARATRRSRASPRSARGYSNLEYDLERGRARLAPGSPRGRCCARLTGAEAALVVNNNAAAVLLALAALAEGREVVVSRGELIEIGDGFRIPDVLARSGARLVEVGTTNRTRADDYERAIGPETALAARACTSRTSASSASPSGRDLETLAEIAQRAGLPLVDDLGSGRARRRSATSRRRRESLARGRRPRLLLRRQAPRRPAGRHRRRPRGARRAAAAPSAPARAPRRQADARRARGDARARARARDERTEIPVLRMLHEPVESVRARAERLAGARRRRGRGDGRPRRRRRAPARRAAERRVRRRGGARRAAASRRAAGDRRRPRRPHAPRLPHAHRRGGRRGRRGRTTRPEERWREEPAPRVVYLSPHGGCPTFDVRQLRSGRRRPTPRASSRSRTADARSRLCESILRELPEWFGIEEATAAYIRDVAALPTFAVEDDGLPRAQAPRPEVRRRSYVMGVRTGASRRGLGTALLEAAEDYLCARGVEYLQVKTLGPSRPERGVRADAPLLRGARASSRSRSSTGCGSGTRACSWSSGFDVGVSERAPEHVLWDLLRGALGTKALAIVADLGVAERARGRPAAGRGARARGRRRRRRAPPPPARARERRRLRRGGAGRLPATPTRRSCCCGDGWDDFAHLFGGVLLPRRRRARRAARPASRRFRTLFGTDFWSLAREHPDERAAFDRAMAGERWRNGSSGSPTLEWRDGETVVDVGGGNGVAARRAPPAPARACAGSSSTCPRPTATRTRSATGIEFVEGSFFERVPAGDVYVLSAILHDWDDERATAILRTIRARGARRRAAPRRRDRSSSRGTSRTERSGSTC